MGIQINKLFSAISKTLINSARHACINMINAAFQATGKSLEGVGYVR